KDGRQSKIPGPGCRGISPHCQKAWFQNQRLRLTCLDPAPHATVSGRRSDRGARSAFSTLNRLRPMAVPTSPPVPADLEPIYRYWDAKRAGSSMPRRADIDPMELVRFLPSLMIVDVVADARRYVYRLVGTREVSARGRDPTGRPVGEAFIGSSREKVFS